MDSFEWIISILSVIAISILVFGVAISVRLGSIDRSTARTVHVLECDVMPRLAKISSNDIGSPGNGIQAIHEVISTMPAKLDQLANQLTTFKLNDKSDVDRRKMKRVGIADVVRDISDDLSQIKTIVRKR